MTLHRSSTSPRSSAALGALLAAVALGLSACGSTVATHPEQTGALQQGLGGQAALPGPAVGGADPSATGAIGGSGAAGTAPGSSATGGGSGATTATAQNPAQVQS